MFALQFALLKTYTYFAFWKPEGSHSRDMFRAVEYRYPSNFWNHVLQFVMSGDTDREVTASILCLRS